MGLRRCGAVSAADAYAALRGLRRGAVGWDGVGAALAVSARSVGLSARSGAASPLARTVGAVSAGVITSDNRSAISAICASLSIKRTCSGCQ